MKCLKIILIWFLCLSLGADLFAQSIDNYNKAALNLELEKLNLEYADVQKRLLEEGYDIETMDASTLSEDDKSKIESILLEMSQQAPVTEKVNVQDESQLPEPEILIEPQEQISLIENKELPVEIYGQDLFRNGIINILENSNQLKAPESYVLGQGDQIVVSIWGRSQMEKSFTIQSDGYIRLLDGKSRVFVKGLSIAQVRSKLKRVLSEYYSFSDGEYDVSVNYSRTVRIAIYGEVYGNAGSYTVSGFNSAFNALSLAKGPSNIGSLRNIKLQKANGVTLDLDVYAFMSNPSIQSNYYLEDNDIILVPVSDKIVSISGAIRRPFKYELQASEGLIALIDFAGGLAENAFQSKIQIKRYINNEQRLIDINWNDLLQNGEDFELLNGDEIYIEDIERSYRNYVSITGELLKPGEYERNSNMRISDLVQKAGLTPNSNKDIIYLVRVNADGTNELIKLNLRSILEDPSSSQNIVLRDLDKLEVWSQERFADEARISVYGAVRYNGDYPYDQNGGLRVADAILLAGGLRRDASIYATIHYNDPLNKKKKYYKTIDNLYEIFDNPSHPNNYELNAFDSLVVQSVNASDKKLFVRIEGAVNQPGEFQYGEDMSIKDLMVLAGGFRKDASMNNIEISRVIIQDYRPSHIVVANLELNKEFEVLTKGVAEGEYKLEPSDNISVKFLRDYNLQKRIFISGEINVPGPYAIDKKNLKISSIIERAGGLTEEAFAGGATLTRSEGDLGSVVIKLDDVLRNSNSKFNFTLKDGDEIFIPKMNEFVTIQGATRVKDAVLDESVGANNLIRVPFHKGENALFYINEFAGGFDEKADKSKVFVEFANGEIGYSKPGLFNRKYPEVRQGSIITVGYKSKPKEVEDDKPKTDWSKVLSDSVGQALSILTLILLVQRID